MTVVCLVILAGIFWEIFLKKLYRGTCGRAGRTRDLQGEFLIRKHHNKA